MENKNSDRRSVKTWGVNRWEHKELNMKGVWGLRDKLARSLNVIVILSFCLSFCMSLMNPQVAAATQEREFHQHAQRSLQALLRNLSHPEIHKGAVIASPSQHSPNYFYHWIRDAALVMDALVLVYQYEKNPGRKAYYLEKLLNWVAFETRLQETPNPSGSLGEPKYNVDGSAYTGDWGRPQNDGPASRAITMIRLANVLLKEGKDRLVRERLYNAPLPARSPIKRDLEYTARGWLVPSFDLWEEIHGHHFYTRMLQRTALILGADLANRLNDSAAAHFYKEQAARLEREILKHINTQRHLIEPTVGESGGWNHKNQSLDVSVVLGSLHSSNADGFFAQNHPLILSSSDQLEAVFRKIYPINQNQTGPFKGLGTAIGRYPEDVYDGNGFGGGNPWFLATHAYAELYCEAAQRFEQSGTVFVTQVNQNFLNRLMKGRMGFRAGQKISAWDPVFPRIMGELRSEAKRYLARSLYHHGRGGEMSEQYNRVNGYMQGATHLTWSYASYLSAYEACFRRMP